MRALGCARAIPAGRSRVRERERVSRGDARVRTRGVRPGSRGVRLADARSRLSFFLSPPRARSTRIARAPLRAESSQKQISSAHRVASEGLRTGKRVRAEERKGKDRAVGRGKCEKSDRFRVSSFGGGPVSALPASRRRKCRARESSVPAFDCSSLGLFAVVGTLRPRSALVASPRARRHGGRHRALPEGARLSLIHI